MSWVPPKSPYGLIQERYWPDEWKVLVCCLCLNLTSCRQLDAIVDELFGRWPTPQALLRAHEDDVKELLSHLGMQHRRTKTLFRFTQEYLAGGWTEAKQLYGCGKYADDCYRIFFRGDWRDVKPKDKALNLYHSHLWETLGGHHS